MNRWEELREILARHGHKGSLDSVKRFVRSKVIGRGVLDRITDPMDRERAYVLLNDCMTECKVR